MSATRAGASTFHVGRVRPESACGARTEIDLETLKLRQQATWASADFGRIGVRLQAVGESLCEAVDLLSTETVLDVAAGDGSASLAAARRFSHATSTDYLPELLEQGRRRAEAERLAVRFRVADAASSSRRTPGGAKPW